MLEDQLTKPPTQTINLHHLTGHNLFVREKLSLLRFLGLRNFEQLTNDNSRHVDGVRCLRKSQRTKSTLRDRKLPTAFHPENGVENHFTAKPLMTYIKNKSHLFGEAIDHLNFDSNLCFSWRLFALF